MSAKNFILIILAIFFATLSCTEPENFVPGSTNNPSGGESGAVRPPAFAEEADDPSVDQVLTFDYSVLADAGHPRLMLSESDFEDLRYRLGKDKENNKILVKLHSIIISQANKYAAKTSRMSDPTAHEDNVSELLALAYAYHVTGGSRYMTRLRSDIDNILDWPHIGTGDLAIGEQSLAIAIVYDWMYYDLTYDERSGLRKLVTDKGIIPSFSKTSQTYGNTNQIYQGGLMCAALAMYEKNKSTAMEKIEKGLITHRAMLEKALTDGGYPEGASYWGYGMTYQVALFQSLLNIFGHTGGLMEIQGVMDSGKYALMVHGANNTTFSYNDGGSTNDSALFPSWWYAAQKQDPTLVYGEYELFNNGIYSQKYSRLTPLIPAFLKSYNPDQVVSSKPDDMVWTCNGEMPLCIVRRGWNYDKTDYYLGIKGGDCNTWETMTTSHGHMDAGSFVFEAEGVRWSDDVMRPSYSPWFSALKNAGSRSGDTVQMGLRWSTFNVNALCHSTIVSYTNDGTISKLHPTDFNVDGKATILGITDDAYGKGAELDMSAPLKGQVKNAARSIILLADGTLQVTDRITALEDKDSIMEWRMLTQSTGNITSSGIELTSIKNTKQKRTLSVATDDPSVTLTYSMLNPVLPKDWTGFTYIQKINDRKIASWKATVPKGETVTFTTTLRQVD
jgi:hypothetical protein